MPCLEVFGAAGLGQVAAVFGVCLESDLVGAAPAADVEAKYLNAKICLPLNNLRERERT